MERKMHRRGAGRRSLLQFLASMFIGMLLGLSGWFPPIGIIAHAIIERLTFTTVKHILTDYMEDSKILLFELRNLDDVERKEFKKVLEKKINDEKCGACRRKLSMCYKYRAGAMLLWGVPFILIDILVASFVILSPSVPRIVLGIIFLAGITVYTVFIWKRVKRVLDGILTARKNMVALGSLLKFVNEL